MLATICVVGLIAVVSGVTALLSGWYNVSATKQHWQPVYSTLERGMVESVRHHARDIVTPPLTAPATIQRGAAIYRDRCVQCHGGPGVAQADFGKSMQPVPGSLVSAAKRWQANELYWITRHGIKMSGMPAWELHLSDQDLWSVVSLLMKLPELSPQEFDRITAVVTERAQ